MNNLHDLLEEIKTTAISRLGDSMVSLYTYGSLSRGDTNKWSDIDVCIIYNAPEAGSVYAEWANDLLARTNFILDPIGLNILDIREDSHWEYAPFLNALLSNSNLLYGIDMRPNIVRPTERKLLLAVCDSTARWLRGLYGLPLDQAITLPLPEIELEKRQQRCVGNTAWELVTTLLQLLRAIIYLETNTFCESKQSIIKAIQAYGDQDVEKAYTNSMSIREHYDRFTTLVPVPDEVYTLSKEIMPLTNRFLADLKKEGLTDPSYQPEGISLYDTSGILIS